MATLDSLLTADTLLKKVEEIAPILCEHAQEAETRRRLSRPVVEAMLNAGLYRMARPQAYGGLELDPVSIFKVVEEVARHDSAAGWNLQLSAAANCVLVWLPDKGVAEILDGHSDTILGGSFTPTGVVLGSGGPYCKQTGEQTAEPPGFAA